MNARRMALSGVSSLCAMVVVLLVACVPALAAEEHPYIPTDSVIGQVGEGQADGVVTDSHGDIYITNHNKDEIQIYSSEAKKITDFKTPSETGNGPTSLAVDSEGAVYVDYFKHGVYKYRPTAFPPTASTTYALEESAGNKGVIVEKEGGAYAIAVDPESQHLYVAEGSHIASYEPNGKLISATIGEGLAPGADYFGLDVYGTNNDIYVTDTKHEKAYILNPQGTKILTEISGVDSPTGPFDANGWQISSLAVDQSDGDVYIFVSQEGSLETTSVVYQFNSAGGYVSKIGNEFGSSLRLRETTVSEIAVDNANDGDVYVTSENKGKADNVYAFGPLTAVAEPVLTVHKYGNGEGTVTSKSMSLDCGLICEAPFAVGEEVELKATPEPGWKFEGWVGCPSPEGPNGELCKVTMTTPLAVAAKFAGKQKLIVSKSGGNGEVTSSPLGIACGSTCSALFEEGKEVVLTATPEAGWKFKGWTGCASTEGPNGEICKVTMNEEIRVNAEFGGKKTLNVATNVISGEGGEVKSSPAGIACGSTCSALFEEGKEVVLTATAETGWKFKKWYNCTSTEGPNGEICKVTMTREITVTAEFEGKRTLNVSKIGKGDVTSSPLGIACGSTCSAAFEEGNEVLLTATEETGWKFKGWTGCTSTEGPNGEICKVMMTEKITVSAEFESTAPTDKLTITKNGAGTGEVECEANNSTSFVPCASEYPEGTKLVVKGNPKPGSEFAGWSAGTGSASSCTTTNNCPFTITTNTTLTATFNPAPVTTDKLTITKNGAGTGEVECEANNSTSFVPCASEYPEGTKLVVKGNPKPGSEFAGWSAGTGSASSCTTTNNCPFTITTNTTLTATFNPAPVTTDKLTITKNGAGTGEVECEANNSTSFVPCASEYPEGTKLVVKGNPKPGSEFAGWSAGTGSASSCTTTNNCPFTITTNTTLTATFNPAPVTTDKLTITKNGAGTGEVECEANNSTSFVPCASEYPEGTKLVVKGNPKPGSEFAGWSAGTGSASSCTTTNNCPFTITTNTTLTATFNPAPVTTDKLTITKNGAGTGEVECEANNSTSFVPCASEYPEGTKLVVKGNPKPGSEFAGWSAGTGSASSCTTTNNCPFTITTNTTLTATFNPAPVTTDKLTITKNGAGTGEVECEANNSTSFVPCASEYPEGTKLVVKGNPKPGSEFAGWSAGTGSASSCTTTNNCPFTITTNTTLTATFNPAPVTNQSTPPPSEIVTPGSTSVAGFTQSTPPSAQEGKLMTPGSIAISGDKALLKLACSAAGPCHGTLKLTIRVKHGSKTKTVVIGQATYHIAAGQRYTIKITLSNVAVNLLRHHRSVEAKLTAPGVSRTFKLSTVRD